MILRMSGLALSVVVLGYAQHAKWAAPDDATAKSLIEMERQWADAECTHSVVVQTILADDFEGTSPEGKLYSKADAVADAKTRQAPARDCHLHDVKVRFIGDNLAIVYGSESAILKTGNGKDTTRGLIWTDTWLKRSGKWQIVAVQDMPAERK
ncbi:MAG TPA: nuclear transport factor 2 family protein [Bryobacteraceae bacterium]|nr:nuclear transport factor 2 family protein [Bryobacteraceae bacterium]